MIDINNYNKEDGGTDWEAYRKAEIEDGEVCSNCQSFIGLGKGEKRLCYSCGQINKGGSLNHEKLLRCPKCKYTWDASDTDEYELFSEGEHGTYCGECDFEFEIQTRVEYNFESPELLDASKGVEE